MNACPRGIPTRELLGRGRARPASCPAQPRRSRGLGQQQGYHPGGIEGDDRIQATAASQRDAGGDDEPKRDCCRTGAAGWWGKDAAAVSEGTGNQALLAAQDDMTLARHNGWQDADQLVRPTRGPAGSLHARGRARHALRASGWALSGGTGTVRLDSARAGRTAKPGQAGRFRGPRA